MYHIVASELKDPICHSNECQIGFYSSEATNGPVYVIDVAEVYKGTLISLGGIVPARVPTTRLIYRILKHDLSLELNCLKGSGGKLYFLAEDMAGITAERERKRDPYKDAHIMAAAARLCREKCLTPRKDSMAS